MDVVSICRVVQRVSGYVPDRRACSAAQATRKIFVRGLGQTTTADSLFTLFSQFGEVAEVNLIKDKTSGQPKGYGFVTMHSIEDADAAVLEPTKIIDVRLVTARSVCVQLGPEHANRSVFLALVGATSVLQPGCAPQPASERPHVSDRWKRDGQEDLRARPGQRTD
jgi:hypothetical protein